jgi:hypothetical protein
VETRVERETFLLYGRPDATGSWARHGRRVERAALELLACPALAAREVRGQLTLGERACRFRWEGETLALLGAARAAPDGAVDVPDEAIPEWVAAAAAALRRARDVSDGARLTIRRAAHQVGVEGGVCLPHLELRDGDDGLYLRVLPPEMLARAVESLRPFQGKTPLVLVGWPQEGEEVTFCRLGETARRCAPDTLLAALRDAPRAALKTAA